MTEPPGTSSGARLSRRALLGAFGTGAVTVAGIGAAAAVVRNNGTDSSSSDGLRYDFYGQNQSGITTPMQDQLHFAALDVTTESRDELISETTTPDFHAVGREGDPLIAIDSHVALAHPTNCSS